MKYRRLSEDPYAAPPETDGRGGLVVPLDAERELSREYRKKCDEALRTVKRARRRKKGRKAVVRSCARLVCPVLPLVLAGILHTVCSDAFGGFVLPLVLFLFFIGMLFFCLKRYFSDFGNRYDSDSSAWRLSCRKYVKEYELKRYGYAVEPYRRYYEYSPPAVVTKCFGSSEEKIKGKEVCVFADGDGSLRLTADLKHGFARTKDDFGCYIFGKGEYEVLSVGKSDYAVKDRGGETRCVLLKVEETYFLLGKRAYRFLLSVNNGDGSEKDRTKNK